MSKKNKEKHIWLIKHRKTMYQEALQKYIDGKCTYEYVQERLNKLKEVIKVKV